MYYVYYMYYIIFNILLNKQIDFINLKHDLGFLMSTIDIKKSIRSPNYFDCILVYIHTLYYKVVQIIILSKCELL